MGIRPGRSICLDGCPLGHERKELTMNENKRFTPHQLVYVAQKIREQLQALVRTRTHVVIQRTETLYVTQARLKSLRRKLQVALGHGWDAAAGKLVERLAAVARDLPHHAQNLMQVIDARRAVTVPSVRCLVEDLRQVRDEFDGMTYDPKSHVLSVSTEPITLDGLYLGPFDVHLYVNRLGRDEPYSAYDIVALDPHPATSNDVVTHPHVSDERLCAGDAVTPINAALSSGRICDFFLLVRGVLTTYNSSSPYVSLENWHGTSCHECGYIGGVTDSNWCTSCEHDFCSECASYCTVCDESTCKGCLENCPVCDEHVCPSCLTRCPDCEDQLCTRCLEQGECACHEKEGSHEDEQENAIPVDVITAAESAA